MNNFKYYIDIVPLDNHIKHAYLKKGDLVNAYRKIISIYVYTLHKIVASKSLPRLPISICEEKTIEPNTFEQIIIQKKVRVFSKNIGVLVNLLHLVNKFNIFEKSANISVPSEVPSVVLGYEIVKRIRIPSAIGADESVIQVIKAIKSDRKNNYINLMTSSCKKNTKKLIRYYYTKIKVDRDNYTGRVDGYGFSRKKSLVCIPHF